MTLYLDTSSLVKLYVEENGSDEVRARVARADVLTTSVVAFAETRATLARMRRDKKLSPARYAQTKQRFVDGWPAMLSHEVTGELVRSAGDLAEQHGLRGFDSIHLATFAHVLEQSVDEVEFSSFDTRMVAAARRLE